jgi:pimeloyl-ACP methyl ester carboxylesterase
MLADLQKCITVAIAVAAAAWFAYFASNGFWGWAIAGFFLIAFGHAGFLALEFALLRVVGRSDPAPRPTWPELFSAWLHESLITPRIFCWRQPFRSHAVPDCLTPAVSLQGRRGIVFIHGFFCNRGFWTPWLERLQGGGHAFVAVSLEPIFASIDDYAPQIDDAVRRVTEVSGLAPLIVCHSMGGLALRAWLKLHRSDARVHHVVTIGTPHRGTWLARFGHGHNTRQMRLLSDWHSQLDVAMPTDRHTRFTCWYSNCDNIVFPASTATLPGANNRLVRGSAHVQLAFVPQVMTATLALLQT